LLGAQAGLAAAPQAPGLSVGEFQANIERSARGLDRVVVRKGPKRVSSFAIPRLSAAPHVVKFERIAGTQRDLLLDYFKGGSGTSVQKSCYEAWVLEVSRQGKLKVLDHDEYRCEASSALPEASGESFNHPYEVEVIAGVARLRR
jgi:hypothetical protein